LPSRSTVGRYLGASADGRGRSSGGSGHLGTGFNRGGGGDFGVGMAGLNAAGEKLERSSSRGQSRAGLGFSAPRKGPRQAVSAACASEVCATACSRLRSASHFELG